MKRLIFVAVAAATAAALPVQAADVGVSIQIGEPGFYGRIDIGDFPHPQLIYPRPMIIVPAPVKRPPIYLRVPPGHAKNWGKYCRKYHACGERVYFVQDAWYNHVYAPRYKEKHGQGHPEGHGRDKSDDHGKGKDKGKDH